MLKIASEEGGRGRLRSLDPHRGAVSKPCWRSMQLRPIRSLFYFELGLHPTPFPLLLIGHCRICVLEGVDAAGSLFEDERVDVSTSGEVIG